MADALDPATIVYQGFWTDWSKGQVWGLTLTLSPTHTSILTNALTMFVTISGIQLWTIIRYTLHQRGVRPQPEDMTPHLRHEQLILRNAGSDLATAWLMFILAWFSRKATGRRSLRSYSIGILALLYAVLFMVAGIFSNRAISAGTINGGSAVLSRSKQCGVWNETYFELVNNAFSYTDEDEFGLFTQYSAKLAHDIQLSLEYAQECYLSQASTFNVSSVGMPSSTNSSTLCHTFRSPRLTWQHGEGSCPFQQPDICLNNSRAVVIETDNIDSHIDLGINADSRHRLQYQRKLTCAVLDDTDHVSGWDGSVVNSSESRPAPNAAHAFYGPSNYKNTPYTYSIANFASFYDNFSAQVTLPYQLDAEMAYGETYPQWSVSQFAPIQELVQSDADLILFFLSFTGMYLDSPVDDPWFSAHEEQVFDTQLPFLNQRYARDKAISTLACTEQHQFCTSNGTCTGFLGFDQVQNVERFNNALSPHQNATFDRMLRAVTASSIWNVVFQLAITTAPMMASSETFSGSSGDVVSQALPPDQWERELTYWFSIAMAQLQRTVVQWATGQIVPEPQYVEYLLPPTLEQDVWFCHNFIVPSTAYQSFSVVAIFLIFGFGSLLVIVSVTIERLGAVTRRCLGRPAPGSDWRQDDMLGLESSIRLGQLRRPATPGDDGSQASRQSSETGSDLELGTINPTSNKHRISSQVLGLDDPAFSLFNGHFDSFDTGCRRAHESPSRSEEGIDVTIVFDDGSSPAGHLPVNILDDEQDRRSRRPTSNPPSSPLSWRSQDSRAHSVGRELTRVYEGLAIRYPAPVRTRDMQQTPSPPFDTMPRSGRAYHSVRALLEPYCGFMRHHMMSTNAPSEVAVATAAAIATDTTFNQFISFEATVATATTIATDTTVNQFISLEATVATAAATATDTTVN
ncbi:hypothetical protein LTR10_018891 [Elasticomyces elasticus]|uniref:Uncharacterized protein n=1 Tax=Exophiala sideris TaxID=1016849 RepID=A0ABR0JIN6_9EURO|nr:hypothetical protein LTR10_018891 [Elasticomyces elasticus]KAK5034465.1 hypothetical protein LTS07_003386 [Exophiala sideris]KAK5042762.1 hypothetical protein LTR13_001610 [Exophiala sideris]KAK5065845.1 hypothetical protein LTR69_003395 [Exophiala sideris]KAK5185694.1 hypothetical protein LTR44_001743 [Eurotiomycetes sp. CCFEE 6388]